jgi:hypothetical protein
LIIGQPEHILEAVYLKKKAFVPSPTNSCHEQGFGSPSICFATQDKAGYAKQPVRE